jgi:F-type H+-transporting ATPase subunit b
MKPAGIFLCRDRAVDLRKRTDKPRVDTVKKISLILLFIVITCVLPAVAFASTEGGEAGWGWWETAGRWVNLLVIFGVIFYFARGFISKFFSDRRQNIKSEIEEARKARESAEAELAEMKDKMSRLDQELEDLHRQAEENARKEKEKIEAEAAAESEKIITSVKGEVDGLMRAARDELKDYAGQLAVDLAARKIRAEMDEKNRELVVKRFLDELSESEGGKQ